MHQLLAFGRIFLVGSVSSLHWRLLFEFGGQQGNQLASRANVGGFHEIPEQGSFSGTPTATAATTFGERRRPNILTRRRRQRRRASLL